MSVCFNMGNASSMIECTDKEHPRYSMLLILALLFGLTQALHPGNASMCNYYARQLLGANNSDTQFQFVQSVVTLAFAGGEFPGSNVSSDLTGILNPGTFNNESIDLQPWFNGSIASTNLNDQPVGINWLDDGEIQPLYDFLRGMTPNVELKNSTNEL